MTPSAALDGPFLLDGHVHFHPCFDPDRFFDSALANFRKATSAVRRDAVPAGWLLFSESSGMDYFRRFRTAAGRPAHGGWIFHRTDEADSLVARGTGGGSLLLVAGRQLVTAEGLEVLALCCDADLDDGLPLPAAVEAARARDAIVVLPWGFGKWWLRRGSLAARFVRSARPTDIFLGDNGGRTGFLGTPRLFRLAARRGIGVLAGSDPFPLYREAKRVGGFGFALDGTVDPLRPAAGIRRLLRTEGRPLPYGRPVGPLEFLRNQLMIRVRDSPAAAGRHRFGA
ncbi:MAG: hypothetical protein F4137_17350 [Acidobacteria bacterium]|nr:hypothetical protein [Acidobacteriota bacterium]MYH30568.1 hypothetical protein [Acidobacteriota bacterium]